LAPYYCHQAINTAFKKLHEDDKASDKASDGNRDWSGADQADLPKKRRMSFKKAMRESTKAQSVPNVAAEDNSRIVAVREGCHFIGSLQIDDKSTADVVGPQMVAIARNNPTKGTPCSLVVSEKRVRALVKTKGRVTKVFFDMPITDIMVCHQEKTQFKTDFAVVHQDKRLDIITTYYVVTPPQGKDGDISLRRHIHNIQVKQAETTRDRSKSVKLLSKSSLYDSVETPQGDTFRLIGNFEATYLGKCHVPNARVPTDEDTTGGLVPLAHSKNKLGEDAVRFVTGYAPLSSPLE
jgi:hypothetical protein